MAKITLNGREVEVKDGMNLVDAAKENGVDIPHYCYHPGLSIAGQCRMCYVELEGNPKLQVACNMKCTDGLKVVTNSPKVKDAVKWSLEFHLINHPIDCPICDQAGECGLQDYYMKHGKYESQMHEDKVLKPKVVDLGDHIVLDKERCILCQRCVRFTHEVSETDEFAIFNRGDRSVIGTVDDLPLTGNYQVNTVDICPVGALTSKDFRFEQRVWFLSEAQSICSGCSKGCNVSVHHKKERHIYRLKPRFNPQVNEWWMCDKGRYTYKDSNYDRRLSQSKLGGVDLPFNEAIQSWASELKVLLATERADEIGVFLTPHQTNEELASILGILNKKFGITKFYSEDIEKIVSEDRPVDGFLLRSDPYPNSRGFLAAMKDAKIKIQSPQELTSGLEKGSITHLIVIAPEGERVLPILGRVAQATTPTLFVAVLTPQLAVQEMFASSLSIPTISHYEKTGTFVNCDGIKQSVSPTLKMFAETRAIQVILESLQAAQQQTGRERERMVR